MFNYISSHNDSYIVIENNKILIIKNNKINTIEHSVDISIVEGNYFVDREKRLYKVEEDIEFLTKLDKSVSKMCLNKGILFIADRFGNVYTWSNSVKKLIMGNLCYTTSMVVYEDKIITSDKYGRIRISDMNGKIISYVFLEDKPIISMCMSKNLVVATKSKVFLLNNEFKIINTFEYEEIRKVINFNNDILILCNNSVILNDNFNNKAFGFCYDAFTKNNDILFIDKTKQLILNSEFITNLDASYDNNFNQLRNIEEF